MATLPANLRAAAPLPHQYVIHISVDGLRPDAVTNLGPTLAPNFYRLRNEGAFTDNARTDVDFTNTLPNHTTQLTGRGVTGPDGHNYTFNNDPPPTLTLHSNKGSYVAGAFDVVHDHGLSTGLYASKSKFVIYDQSYDATNGAHDSMGADDGRDKIDTYVFNATTQGPTGLVSQFVDDMAAAPLNYSLLHLRNPDSAGHANDWNVTVGSDYMNAVVTVDGLLGDVFDLVEQSVVLNGHTSIMLTSDHGGTPGTFGHGNSTLASNYTIPFYVWGPTVDQGVNLYALNPSTRADPGATQPPYTAPLAPIRNGDAANLALSILGLGPVTGSTINEEQNLAVAATPVKHDVDGDGQPDIVWRNTMTGQNAFWRVNEFAFESAVLLLDEPDTDWRIGGMGDFNHDGDNDLVWHHQTTGETRVWFMDDGNFIGEAPLLQTLPQWRVVAVDGFDADSNPDLLWHHQSDGRTFIWLMDGVTFSQAVALPTSNDLNWTFGGTGDFNFDASPDIVRHHNLTGETSVWLLDGAAFTGAAPLATTLDTDWRIGAVADYNNDDLPDIVWHHQTTGQNAMWLMNGTTISAAGFLLTTVNPDWHMIATQNWDPPAPPPPTSANANILARLGAVWVDDETDEWPSGLVTEWSSGQVV